MKLILPRKSILPRDLGAATGTPRKLDQGGFTQNDPLKLKSVKYKRRRAISDREYNFFRYINEFTSFSI